MLKESLLTVENELLKAKNGRLQLKYSEAFTRVRGEVERLNKENNKLKTENEDLERKYLRILKQLEKHTKRDASV
jgi:prefoldin subunit 5